MSRRTHDFERGLRRKSFQILRNGHTRRSPTASAAVTKSTPNEDTSAKPAPGPM
jgi:hypothetical protein